MADKPEVDNPERGWGQVFPGFFDTTVSVENHAMNGRSTRSFLAEDRWSPIVQKLKHGDYVFIQFGHNDEKKEKIDRYTSPEEYRTNLIRFVNETRDHGAVPVLCTPIVRRRFTEEGIFYDEHGPYPDIVREVAAECDVPLIDMHRKSEALVRSYGPERSKELFIWVKAGQYLSLPQGREDNTHFSEFGALCMAKIAIEGIRESDLPLESHLK